MCTLPMHVTHKERNKWSKHSDILDKKSSTHTSLFFSDFKILKIFVERENRKIHSLKQIINLSI